MLVDGLLNVVVEAQGRPEGRKGHLDREPSEHHQNHQTHPGIVGKLCLSASFQAAWDLGTPVEPEDQCVPWHVDARSWIP